MKKIIFYFVLGINTFCFSQNYLNSGIIQKEVFKNSAKVDFKVILFEKNHKKIQQPLIYLDSIIISQNSVQFLNADDIKEIKVEKGKFKVGDLSYDGKMFINTKNPNKHEFISLKEITNKFTNCNSKNSIYRINNQYLFDDINLYQLELKNILNISILNSNLFENLDRKVNFNIIQIFTKTKENIDSQSKILIR
jgi:hypothetical protein